MMFDMFTQATEGKFTCRTKPGSPHCGPSDFPIKKSFSYRVSISYSDSALDEQGFLLDNTFFDGYFAAFNDCLLGISCEKLAKLICEDLKRSTDGRAVSVKVDLEGIPNVWVSYSWQGGAN